MWKWPLSPLFSLSFIYDSWNGKRKINLYNTANIFYFLKTSSLLFMGFATFYMVSYRPKSRFILYKEMIMRCCCKPEHHILLYNTERYWRTYILETWFLHAFSFPRVGDFHTFKKSIQGIILGSPGGGSAEPLGSLLVRICKDSCWLILL